MKAYRSDMGIMCMCTGTMRTFSHTKISGKLSAVS